MQYQQQQYEASGQQQFMGQSSVQHQVINNGSSNYQHSINDLLVQPTPTLQQNLFNSQEALAANQSVSFLSRNSC